jgi:(p)ppGpp synthase/HD superfamily hydrolase
MIKRALDFANEKHKDQIRKGSHIPYVFHLTDTACYVAQLGCDEEMVAAALLHDSVEDVGVSYEEIETLFGKRVSHLVRALSESDKTRPWKERKIATINGLKNSDCHDIKVISCADKLSNIKSILFDINIIGDEIWNRFNAGYEDQKWYYTELVKCYISLEGICIYNEFVEAVNKIFGE